MAQIHSNKIGDNCVDKPLLTLWRNYTQINKPNVTMRILVCPSGLKVTTRQHGLTEYWANRICFCCAPKNYPRVFCWIYRHEGRKLKHELRCHAVLCPKDSVSEQICKTLKVIFSYKFLLCTMFKMTGRYNESTEFCFIFKIQENLSQALKEFKRDKMNRQNARLSLVNSLYENPSMPRRKILLSVGANNYRPPMERSKSAPKLMAIEEAICEEEDVNLTPSLNRAESHSSCCNVDLMLASSTSGRSNYIRYKMNADSAKARSISLHSRSILDDKTLQSISSPSKYFWLEGQSLNDTSIDGSGSKREVDSNQFNDDAEVSVLESGEKLGSKSIPDVSHSNMNILLGSLSEEILSYFDSKLKLQSSASESDELNINPNGIYETDEKCDQAHLFGFDGCNSNNLRCDQTNKTIFFNQNEILDSLIIASDVNETDFKYDILTDTETKITLTNLNTSNIVNPIILDSDEGSLTSGCERDIVFPSIALSSMLTKSSISDDSEPIEYSAATSAQNQLILTSSKVDCNMEESEFSDESGFDENNVSKVDGFLKIHNRIEKNCLYNADANNNVKRVPSSNMGRLTIKLPKNAKSIDI